MNPQTYVVGELLVCALFMLVALAIENRVDAKKRRWWK